MKLEYMYITKYKTKIIKEMKSMYFFDTFTIGYITKGNAKFIFPDNTVLYANEGDAIYIPYTTYYMSTWTGSPDIEFYSLQYRFSSPWDIMYKFKVIKKFPEKGFANLLEAYEKKDNFISTMSCFYSLLENIFSNLQHVTPLPKYPEIKKAVEYIESNFTDKIKVEFLAKLCNLSQARFYSLFKSVMGITPIEYKNNLLADHAIYMLRSTNCSIEEISEKLGFCTPGYFRRLVKKKTGKLPKQIRSGHDCFI